MKNHIIISLLFLSVGLSQQEYDFMNLIEMDNGLWTEKFSDEPISGKVYGGFGEVKPLKKVYIGNLLNGKKEGRWKSYYHSTGKKKYDLNFKDGKPDGINTEWYENGQKTYEGTHKDGKQDGLWTEWYDNGQKKYEGTFKDGKRDGKCTGWYEDGKKEEEGTFKDSIRDGKWTYYNEDGTVKEVKEY
mgnify:CR=1 FL=1